MLSEKIQSLKVIDSIIPLTSHFRNDRFVGMEDSVVATRVWGGGESQKDDGGGPCGVGTVHCLDCSTCVNLHQ